MPEKFLTPLQIVELATPAVPDAGALGLYPKSDDNLYSQNNAGRELAVGFAPFDVPSGDYVIPDNYQVVSGRDLTIENGFLWVLGDLIEAPAPLTGTDEITTFSKSGALTVATGAGRFVFPYSAVILGVVAAVNTAPTGASLIVDVLKNGVSTYVTTANRPTIAASAFSSYPETVPDVTSITAGDYLQCGVTQIGSTIAGSDLTVMIRYRR
jgi:hypothetical protein